MTFFQKINVLNVHEIVAFRFKACYNTDIPIGEEEMILAHESTKKVPLELLCMELLQEREMYGYEMVQEIEQRSGGLLRMSLASLYVALRRLEEAGYVTTRSTFCNDRRGRVRVYYTLQDSSKEYHEAALKEHLDTAEGMRRFLESTKAPEKKAAKKKGD